MIYSVKYFQTQSSPKIQYITKPNVCKVIGDMPRLTRRDINVLSLAFALGDIIGSIIKVGVRDRAYKKISKK